MSNFIKSSCHYTVCAGKDIWRTGAVRDDIFDARLFDGIFYDFCEEIAIFDDINYLNNIQLNIIDNGFLDKEVYLICQDHNGKLLLDHIQKRENFKYTFDCITNQYSYLHHLQQHCLQYKQYFPHTDDVLDRSKIFGYLGGRIAKIRDETLNSVDLSKFHYSYGLACESPADPYKTAMRGDSFIGPPKYRPNTPQDVINFCEMNYHFPTSYYDDYFFELVIETMPDFVDNKMHLYITEKSWKPFFSMNPQIILGNVHTLKALRNAGFETFEDIFDESYDTERDVYIRQKKIINEINRISALSKREIENMYKKVIPKLKHNRFHFETLHIGSTFQRNPLLTIFNKIIPY